MERRAPQRLVGVDVPEPRDDPLVEQNGLDRRAPGRQPRGEPVRRETGTERLGAVLPDEVFAAPLDGDDAIAFELLGDLEEVDRAGEPRVEDLDAHERPARETRLELGADRLDLR